MKKQSWIIYAITVLGFCLAFTACPTDDDSGSEKQDSGPPAIELTNLVNLPWGGAKKQTVIAEQAQFTGVIGWEISDNGSIWEEDANTVFVADKYYRALVTLTAKSSFTFNGVERNAAKHQFSTGVTNPAGTGTTLKVTVRFSKTPVATARTISLTNLALALDAPSRQGTPATSLTQTAEYSGTVTWKENGTETTPATFRAGAVYVATVTPTARTGYTLLGLGPNSFTHSGATSAVYDVGQNQINIVFRATAPAGSPEPVTLFSLNSIAAPALRATPSTTGFNNDQYTAAITGWYYNDDNTPITGALVASRAFRAAVTITPKDGYTLTGVPANAFVHSSAVGGSNAAGSGAVTLNFAPKDWTPGTITNVTTYTGMSIKGCCWYQSSSSNTDVHINKLLNTDTNYWDYAYGSDTARNFTSWTSVLNNPTGSLTRREGDYGHPRVFLDPAVPEPLRRRAHCFTVDFGSEKNYVRFGMCSRDTQRFPHQIEIFYSNDPIEAIPDLAKVTSLGIFDIDPSGTGTAGTWKDVDLYPRTPDKRGVKARYFHVRIYKTSRTGDGFIDEETYIEPSFRQIRWGTAQYADNQ